MLQVRDAKVRHADGLHLAGAVQLLHLAPGVLLVPGTVDSAGAVWVGGEERGCLVGDEAAVLVVSIQCIVRKDLSI